MKGDKEGVGDGSAKAVTDKNSIKTKNFICPLELLNTPRLRPGIKCPIKRKNNYFSNRL
jgi:hypothetical protein